MSDKIINFEKQRLNIKLKTYKEDLQTNYIIGRRKIDPKAETKVEVKIDQYDLFNIQTHEPYMTLSVFSDLGLMNIEFANSEITCALALNSKLSMSEYETISTDEIESMITYIQFMETEMYANDLEPMPKLVEIKNSTFYEEYQRVLVAIQCCISSAAKLYI